MYPSTLKIYFYITEHCITLYNVDQGTLVLLEKMNKLMRLRDLPELVACIKIYPLYIQIVEKTTK